MRNISRAQQRMVYIGNIDHINTVMMNVRWKLFHFSRPIPQASQIKMEPCGHCFAKLILDNKDWFHWLVNIKLHFTIQLLSETCARRRALLFIYRSTQWQYSMKHDLNKHIWFPYPKKTDLICRHKYPNYVG